MKKPTKEERLKSCLEVFTTAKEVLLLELFKAYVKPVADRYNLEMEWGMGGVVFINEKGDDVTDCKAVMRILEQISGYIKETFPGSKCDPLWDLMSGLSVEGCFYHKSYGIQRYSGMKNTHTKHPRKEAL
jgi:hypothetical protein